MLDDVGEQTSRKETVAALLFSSDPARLDEAIERYEDATVNDAFVAGQPRELVLTPTFRPGPRQPQLFELPPATAPAGTKRGPSTPLCEMPTVRIGLSLPVPLKHALDATVEMHLADRDDALSAVILDAPQQPEQLGRLLRKFRSALTTDVVIPDIPPPPHATVPDTSSEDTVPLPPGTRQARSARRRYRA